MIYKNTWLLTGTPEQQAIVKDALDNIHFPWHKLTLPQVPTEIGWQNLNGQALESEAPTLARHHSGGTIGNLNGRKYILGVFHTHTGKIYIDNHLVEYPGAANTTVSAEIAHAVDYFLPITDDKKVALMKLMQGSESDAEHGEHTWWEKLDYGAEYYGLIGEAFMQAFTVAYSGMPFDNTSFTHGIALTDGYKVREILGLERTDTKAYLRAGKSMVYHGYKHGQMKSPKTITNISGLRPCKICIR